MTTSKTPKKSSEIKVLNPKTGTANQKDLISDSIELANESEFGDVVGYAIVTIYKDSAYNCRYLCPDDQTTTLFSLYVSEILKEYTKEE